MSYFFETISAVGVAIYTINFFLFLLVFQAVRMLFKLTLNKIYGISTKPFSTNNIDFKRRVLVLGDSTAVGTGASRPEDTISGRFARDYPDSQILNMAENGGLVRDVCGQIDKVSEQVFDLVILSVGGNDVWHLTRLSKIKDHLNNVLPKLVAMSNGRVIFLIYNNIGSAPIFPFVMRGFLKRRCIKIQNVIKEVSYKNKVPTIDLFSDDSGRNPFLDDSVNAELFAPDGIHPSSEGYKLWYNRMWRKMTESGYRY